MCGASGRGGCLGSGLVRAGEGTQDRLGPNRELFYSGSVFKAEYLDGFVVFINSVINQIVSVDES